MEMNRTWAMPNKWTFLIKPIRKLLLKYKVGKGWFDPFAGMNSPAEITNDHREECKALYHLDALDFVSQLENRKYKGCLFDPPYSIQEVKRHYDEIGLEYNWKVDPTGGFSKVKDKASCKIKAGGIVIYFGWNSNAFGKKRGYKIEEVLLIAHGGNHNDTIITVERKIRTLFDD